MGLEAVQISETLLKSIQRCNLLIKGTVIMALILSSTMRYSITVLLYFFLVGCSKDIEVSDCKDLLAISSLSNVQDKLVVWVDNYSWGSLSTNDFSYGGGVVPGQYRIPDNGFDWGMLEMDQNLGQLRIVTGATLEKEPVLSVSFAEYSRQSVLVKHKGSDTFGIKDTENLHVLSDRVAVYCNR